PAAGDAPGMTSLAGLFDVVATAGGSVALTFIVALALGLGALTVFFLGSSVVVLERFARAVRSPLRIVLFGVLWSGVVALVLLETLEPEVAGLPWTLWGRRWAALALRVLGSMLVVVPLTALLLRKVAPRRLAQTSLAALGLGYALLVGGLGQPLYAGIPALLCAAAWLAPATAARKRPAAAEARALLLPLVLALAAGVPVALLLPGPELAVAGAGMALFQAFGVFVVLGLLPLAAAGFVEMRRSAEWFIAVRYLVAKRRQTFISVITVICVGGVASGVWLIVTVLSVMNGFEQLWREEIIGNRAHFTVHSGLGPFEDYSEVVARVEQVPGVVAAAPYLEAEGMVRGSSGEIVGVRIRGIDPARVGDVTDLREDLVIGSIDALSNGHEGEDPGIVIGSQLAAALALQVGDPMLVISPFGGPPTPLGPGPRLSRFQVAGVFQSSFFQYDQIFTFVSLSAAQSFRRTADVVEGIEVRAKDPYRSVRVGGAVEEALGFPFFTRDWKEFFPSFFQALKTERVMMFVLLAMIMVVAAFIIVATLIMMIMEKSSDIAILKAMGATDAVVERIFAIEGTLIGLVGTALGIVAGIAVTTQLNWIRDQIESLTGIDTLPASVYQFSNFPWEFDVLQIAGVAVIAMVLSLGATLLPSRQGARLDPAEGLRYE
ncbi:MAG: lipoprotein-releasing ABC transporter permease subunit, partial [Myxococcota bacterium]